MDNAKKNKINAALYIVLSLIIVAVVCMTVFSIVSGSKRNDRSPIITDRPSESNRPSVTTDTNNPEETPGVTAPPSTDKENNDTNGDETDSEKVDAPVKMIYIEPVNGYLLKGFDIDLPVYSITMNDYRVHAGIDVLAETGSPVRSISEGVIQNIYNDPMMGNCISILHPNGMVSYYMGLSSELGAGVEEGAPVYCGQVISSIGDSTLIELAEEPHLHLELKMNGEYIDPLKYVDYEPTSSPEAAEKSYEG